MDIVSFLKKHGMYSEDLDPDLELEKFLAEMREALDGKDRSLLMIPTYIGSGNRPNGQRVIALDAGGTHYRVSLVCFDEAGTAQVRYLEKMPMPGTRGALDKDAFFGEIAAAMMPIARESDQVGFCFSFPADILPDREGRIIGFAKEVRVSGAEGALIGENINRQLRCLGCNEKKIVILNDTAATLLAGMAEGRDRYDGYTGFILGTGTNTAYLERAGNIGKVISETDLMIINMESGMYDGFPQGDHDRELDRESSRPGDHLTEKMISGAYMGELIWRTVRDAVAEGLFSREFGERFARRGVFCAADITEFCDGSQGSAIAELIADDKDETVLRRIIENYFDRAARILAVSFAAILIQTDTGCSRERPHCVTAEGTTFERSRLLRMMLARYITGWINGKLGRYCEIRQVEQATIRGSALAAIQSAPGRRSGRLDGSGRSEANM